ALAIIQAKDQLIKKLEQPSENKEDLKFALHDLFLIISELRTENSHNKEVREKYGVKLSADEQAQIAELKNFRNIDKYNLYHLIRRVCFGAINNVIKAKAQELGVIAKDLPENPTSLEKAKYELCEKILAYQEDNHLSDEEISRRIGLNNDELDFEDFQKIKEGDFGDKDILESNANKTPQQQSDLESKKQQLTELENKQKELEQPLDLNVLITKLQQEIKVLEKKTKRTVEEEALLTKKKKQLAELLKKQNKNDSLTGNKDNKAAWVIGCGIVGVVLVGLVLVLARRNFTYEYVFKVYISPQVDETKLTFKNLPKDAEINLINAQRHLNYHYPTQESKEKLTKLNISTKNLEGDLDLTDFINLKDLDYNLLTNLTLPTNPTNLKTLDLKNNNFPLQDLAFLVPTTNLEQLELGN
ncbi:10191_t:CDS:2, partial [Entrophospora sp. SA101]